MKKKAVTIYDIAQRLGLSPSTISRALRNDHRINIDTKRLVADTASAMNYQANRVAAGLRGGSTHTIGIVVPQIARQFFASAISGITEVARRRGYQVIITQSNERLADEKENVTALTAARVDGIIASLCMETRDAEHFRPLHDRNFPLVFFDRVINDFPASQVTVNDEACAYAAMLHLIEGGARRIAHLGGPESVNIYHQRYRGYLRALRDSGLPVAEELIDRDCLLVSRGAATARRLLKLADPPDAVFSASDFSALGYINYYRQQGLRVPEDLAIVGFANEPFTTIMQPELSSVEQFSERMGVMAAELLFRQIDSDTVLPVERIVTEGELRVRTSSLRAAAVNNG